MEILNTLMEELMMETMEFTVGLVKVAIIENVMKLLKKVF